MHRFEGVAAQLGVTIEHHHTLPHGRWGDYRHHRRTIRLLDRMAPVQYVSTLAHELGHAHYGHRRTTGRTELEADAWAARQLIDPAEWRYLTTIHADLLTVAAELQVLPRIAAVYAKHLSRHPALRAD